MPESIDALSLLFRLIQVGNESTEMEALLDANLQHLLLAFHAESAVIFRAAEGRLRLVHHATVTPDKTRNLRSFTDLPLDDSTFAGRVARSRQTQALDSGQWVQQITAAYPSPSPRAGIGTPLATSKQLIGVLVMTRGPECPFSADEVRLVEMCGAYLALAIEHATLFANERLRIKDLRLLLEMGQVITGSLDLEEVLQSAVMNLPRLVDATDAWIWLIDPATGFLHGAAASSSVHREHFLKIRLAPGTTSLAAAAIAQRGPVRVKDAKSSSAVNQTLNLRYNMKSLVAFPLQLRGEALGAVSIGDTDRERLWSDFELERATVMADQLAVAVANARFFADLKQSYQALARTQAQLVQSERLAALGELAAVVAHEVRNPLGVIFNSMAGLRRLLKPTGEAEALLNMAREEAERLNTIVGDLLDFSRPRSPDLRPHALRDVIAAALHACQAICTTQGVQVSVDIRDLDEPILVDESMLRQGLVNLILNAVQAMTGGGRVTVTARAEPREDQVWLHLDVSDSGPGVPPAVAEKIFQPFFTTRATGSGLGLAVVKSIAEAHLGDVVLQPSRSGATFTLRLPLREVPPEEASELKTAPR